MSCKQQELFQKVPKVGVWVPGSAEAYLKLTSQTMLRIWLFFGVRRCLGPRMKLRLMNFLAPPPPATPGSGIGLSLAYSEAKHGT